MCCFFTIVQLEHGDQASSDWPDPTKLGHWKGSGLRTLSHVPASFWIAVFGTVARAVKYRLVRYSGSIYVMFDHDWHTLTWWALRHKATRSSTFLINQKPKQCVCVSPLVGHILSTSLWYSDGSSVFCLQTGPQKGSHWRCLPLCLLPHVALNCDNLDRDKAHWDLPRRGPYPHLQSHSKKIKHCWLFIPVC